MTNERWGIELDGQAYDLQDLLGAFARPFDPFAEQRTVDGESRYYLFSSRLILEEGAEAVRALADGIIDPVNGAMRLLRGSEKLRVAGVADFGAVPPLRHVSAHAVGRLGRLRIVGATGTVVVTDADGAVIPPAPLQPSAPQRWLTQQENTRAKIEDLLAYCARCDDWFDLYKLIEAASDAVGGEHKLVALCGDRLKDAKITANFYRHHSAYQPPLLMSLEKVRMEALQAARVALDRLVPPPIA